jgi:hypothetical protein
MPHAPVMPTGPYGPISPHAVMKYRLRTSIADVLVRDLLDDALAAAPLDLQK